MDGLTLLAEARQAGLKVSAEGDRLRIRGPSQADSIARKLLANKAEVFDALGIGVNASHSPRGAWQGSDAELVTWYLIRRQTGELPRDSFALTRWAHVADPRICFASLDRDCLAGPDGPRALYGALQADLRRLKELYGV